MAVSTLLPGQWIKPLVEVGYLPAHAQGSGGTATSGTATNGTSSTTLAICTNSITTQPGNSYDISFDYTTPSGTVAAGGATVQHSYQFQPSGLSGTINRTLAASNITGDGYSGSISYTICMAFGSETYVTNTVAFTGTDGSQSSSSSFTIVKQAGANQNELGEPFIR